jgi:hypothetical protein
MPEEKISLTKAASSIATPLYWVKTVMYMLGMLAIIGLGYAVYKAYIKKPLPSQAIQVQSGGTVQIHQETKVNKHMFIPFVEATIGREKNYDDFVYGIKAGARYELW